MFAHAEPVQYCSEKLAKATSHVPVMTFALPIWNEPGSATSSQWAVFTGSLIQRDSSQTKPSTAYFGVPPSESALELAVTGM